MYDDDGETPEAFEKGKYELLQFASRVRRTTGSRYRLPARPAPTTSATARSLSMVIHNVDAKPAAG